MNSNTSQLSQANHLSPSRRHPLNEYTKAHQIQGDLPAMQAGLRQAVSSIGSPGDSEDLCLSIRRACEGEPMFCCDGASSAFRMQL
jgi:hypothetical protein